MTGPSRRRVIGGAAAAALAQHASAAGHVAHNSPKRPVGRLIDVHAHFVPDGYRAAAIAAGHAHPDGMPAIPPWTEAGMIEVMDRLGISAAMLSISSPGVHFGDDAAARALAREVNGEGARLRKAHPVRFGHFASLPLPDVAGSLAEIAHALDVLGADGVVIESNSNGLYPGDAELEPVFAELDRRAAVVFMHPTSPHCPCCATRAGSMPRPIIEFMFETTRAVTNLIVSGTLDRYRRMRVIVPHGGAALSVLADRIALGATLLPDKTLTPPRIMAMLARLHYDLAGAPVPRMLPALRTFADPARLLYGSDWPFTPEPAVAQLKARLVEHLAAEPALLAAIGHRNAEALFPRLASTPHPGASR